MRLDIDYSQAPLLFIWEVTRACALACRHCRAAAEDQRDPGELSTVEGKRLLADVAEMGTPLVVFTGGDPLQREDLEELIGYAKGLGLRVGTIPACTPRLTRERVAALQAAGVDQMALSIDGPDAVGHDDFRQVEGSFAKALEAAGWARELGLPLQVNTVFAKWNQDHFPELAALVESLGIVFWEVFFLVPTGRGAMVESCGTEDYERLFAQLADLAQRAPFVVKVTEAPHFRIWQRLHPPTAAPAPPPAARPKRVGGHPTGPHHRRIGLAPRPVNSGKGFCFVDHVGAVYPSGFLPTVTGNVRDTSVSELYREHPVFLELRRPELLRGRCGGCAFKADCGGSRARAYALHQDYLAEEPFCRLDEAAPSPNREPQTATVGGAGPIASRRVPGG